MTLLHFASMESSMYSVCMLARVQYVNVVDVDLHNLCESSSILAAAAELASKHVTVGLPIAVAHWPSIIIART